MEDELLLLSKLCSDYEANQVMAEMQTTIKEVEQSEYFCNMVQQLQKNGSMFKDNILRILGCTSSDEEDGRRLQMVIYGLGSIQFSYFSQYQLSLAILLRRDFSHWIGGIIEVYDPRGTTSVDAKVMKALGCKVLININDKLHKRVVDERRPKLFFMPHVPCTTVVKDLLLANWCPSRLNKMVLFTDSFHIAVADLQKLKIRTIDDIIGLGDETLMNNLPKTNLHEHSTLGCDGGDGRVDDETKYLLKTNVEYTLLELDCDGRPYKPEEYCSKESYRRGVPCDVKVCKWPFTHLNWHFFNFFDDVHQLEALLLPETKTETKLTEKMRMMRDGEEEENDEYKLVQADDHKLSSCLKVFLRKDEELGFIMDNNSYKFKDWSQLLCKERYPCRLSKRIWYPPSTGWIKLNFSAVVGKYKDGGREGIAVVGYGGIFHNENNECLLTYSIPLLEEEEEDVDDEGEDEDDEDGVDLDFANADALRKGLRLYMDLRYLAKKMDKRKLVIEGDSVSIVRWVNGVFPPPKRLVEVFEEIHDLLSSIDEHVVFHIYKEANSMAIELANKGAMLLDQEIVSW